MAAPLRLMPLKQCTMTKKSFFSRESVPHDLQRASRILDAFNVDRLGWREIHAVDAFDRVIVLVLLDDILLATSTSTAVDDHVWR